MQSKDTKGSLSFIPLGVGDAFSQRYYASSLLVGFEESWLLIDCPHPVRKMLREGTEAAGITLDLDGIEAVVLTHLHADHCSGVEGLLFFNHFALQRRPSLIAHAEVGAKLWSGHLSAGMGTSVDVQGRLQTRSLEDFACLVDLPDDQALRFGPFSIECRKTLHTIPTTALRLSAGGRTLGYSADTTFDPTLIDWFAGVDLFVHETNFGIHTDYEKLVQLPLSVRKRMRLIHYPDTFNVEGSEIEALREGRLYAV